MWGHVKTGEIQLRSASVVLYLCQFPGFDNALLLYKMLSSGEAGKRVPRNLNHFHGVFFFGKSKTNSKKIFFKRTQINSICTFTYHQCYKREESCKYKIQEGKLLLPLLLVFLGPHLHNMEVPMLGVESEL